MGIHNIHVKFFGKYLATYLHGHINTKKFSPVNNALLLRGLVADESINCVNSLTPILSHSRDNIFGTNKLGIEFSANFFYKRVEIFISDSLVNSIPFKSL